MNAVDDRLKSACYSPVHLPLLHKNCRLQQEIASLIAKVLLLPIGALKFF